MSTTELRPTIVETAAAEKLWAQLIECGPQPYALDWLRDEYQWAGAPDFKSATFELALRTAAWEITMRPLWPGSDECPDIGSGPSMTSQYMGAGDYASGREWSGNDKMIATVPNWRPFHVAALKCYDLLEYVESLP
jgi:hypothetical protein